MVITLSIALTIVVSTWLGVRLSASDGFYLVIGASAAKGFEPVGTMGSRGPNEAATNNGYPNDVGETLAKKGSPLTLVNIACPGETVQTLVHGGDACSPSTSLLSRAENFLRDHHGENRRRHH